MTKKRWLLLTACLASLIAVPIVVYVFRPPAPAGVTQANFDRIMEGMTRVEVDEILGGASTQPFDHGHAGLPRGRKRVLYTTPGRRGAAIVVFDEQDRAVDKGFAPDNTFLGRLRETFPWFSF